MGAVAMLAGHEIRRRWLSTIAIVLLVGVVGAIVLATAAGARRSDTALARFNAVSRSSALEISIGQPTAAQLAEFRRTPGIVGMAHLRGYSFSRGSDSGLAIAAPLGPAMGRDVDASRIIAGRRADPSAPDEMVIGESLAQQLHLGVGDHFDTGSYTQDQITNAFAGGDPGKPAGPTLSFRIVGIDRRPLDLGVRSKDGGVVTLTPAFHEQYQGKIGEFTDVLRVRTTGPAATNQVNAAARRVFGDAPTFGTKALGIETEGARSAIEVLTLALWIVAGATALAGLVAIGIVLSRDIVSANLDQPTLRALGLNRRQRIATNAPRSLLIGGGRRTTRGNRGGRALTALPDRGRPPRRSRSRAPRRLVGPPAGHRPAGRRRARNRTARGGTGDPRNPRARAPRLPDVRGDRGPRGRGRPPTGCGERLAHGDPVR